MPILIPRTWTVILGEASYADKVNSIAGNRPVGYWPLWEQTGAVATDISGSAHHGAYTGVTLGQTGIGDGRTCPLFDGTNDYVDVYSASLAAAWPGGTITTAGWLKVSAAGVWTDTNIRNVTRFLVDGNNYNQMYSDGVGNLVYNIKSGGVNKAIIQAMGGTTAWVHVAQTLGGGNMKAYMNGVQSGLTQAGLGAWVGAPIITECVLGATNITPGSVWSGYLAHWAIWNTALSDAQILTLATV